MGKILGTLIGVFLLAMAIGAGIWCGATVANMIF